jgi:predicted DNA-binding protein (UPF0251 family)
MANVRLTMRKIREVLWLHFECDRDQRESAEAVGTSTTTVWHYLRGWRDRVPSAPSLAGVDTHLIRNLYRYP